MEVFHQLALIWIQVWRGKYVVLLFLLEPKYCGGNTQWNSGERTHGFRLGSCLLIKH